ncbi:MAG TPA: ABC transporter permease [Actinophytocola sp.]|uniref:ABC transporter permease n=1 Tax=Actinophytocola sp. TaxID=1872138 RepID=UPI002F93F8E5
MPARSSRLPTMRRRTLGPVLALAVLVVAFGLVHSTFFQAANLSLVVEQSLVVGTLALGQALVILTAGVDLANAAVAVLGTLVVAKLAMTGTPGVVALLMGLLVAAAVAAVTGGLVTGLKLPPFIVTFGMLVIVGAVVRLYAAGRTYSVTDGAVGWLGTTKYLFGRIELTYGMGLMLVMYLVAWFVLKRTRWGEDIKQIGADPRAARRAGIRVRPTTLTVYVAAGVCYGVAAWQALGRVPIADPEALPLGNLDSITAVVVGGVSLFGGRGSVLGTLAGALIVVVLRTGLAQSGVDTLYQDIAVGVLMIAAVAVDRFSLGRQR